MTGSGDQPANSAELDIAVGPLVAPVFSRVVGMMAARAQFPVDRLDNALLVADTLAAHGPEQALDGRLHVSIVTGERSLRLTLGPLRPNGGSELMSRAAIPGLGNVLEKAVDSVSVDSAPDGAGDVLVIDLGFEAGGAA